MRLRLLSYNIRYGGSGREAALAAVVNAMRPDLVVSIGGDDEAAGAVNPPAQEAQQVERGLIGPVRVLDRDHGNRTASREPVQNGPKERIARGAVVEELT